MKKLFYAAAAIGGLVTFSPMAEAKVARCDIVADGRTYKGPCEFKVYEKGSFTVEATNKGKTILGYSDIGVWISAPGVAEVQYHDGPDGVHYGFLGEVRRGSKNKACWFGDRAKICVY